MLQTGEVSKKGRRISVCSRESVGERIRYFRKQRGWSQIELAEGVCSTSLISLIETGATGTTVEMLVKIADKLMVPLQEIYQDVEGECPNVVKLKIAEAYILRGEIEKAEEMLRHLGCQDNITMSEWQELVLLQGMLRNKQRRSEEAIVVLQPLVDQIELKQNAEDELICKLYTQLGTAYYQLRKFAQSYSAYQRAYHVAMRLPAFEMTAAKAAYHLGMILNELEMREKAIGYLDQAREYFETVSDIPNLANTYFYSAVATKNESYISRALSLYQSLDAVRMVQVVRQYHASEIEAKKDYKKALQELKTIASEMESAGNRECIYILASAVFVCLDNSDLVEAQTCMQLATEMKEKLLDLTPYELSVYFRAKAKLDLVTENYRGCVENAELSSELFETMGIYQDSADALDLAVEGYQKQGLYELACETSKKVSVLLRRKGVL